MGILGGKINQTNDEILNETQGKKINFFPSPLGNNDHSFPVDNKEFSFPVGNGKNMQVTHA